MIENLIILSAELISPELQVHFGKIPTCMIPFNGRPVIDFIYHENYNHYKKIYLLVCKESTLVTKHIESKQFNIEIIVMKNSKSLIDSFTYALKKIDLKGETTLIFGDTYLPYMTSLFTYTDAIVYHNSFESDRWTVSKVMDGQITFFDKVKLNNNSQNEIIVGIFNFTQPQKLIEIFDEKKEDEIKFYELLMAYYNQTSFLYINTEAWVDYGHEDKYFEQKKNVPARNFNSIEIDSTEMSLTKKSSHKSKLITEIKWFLNLPNELRGFSPKIINYSIENDSPFVKMEYFNYLTLHEVFVFGNLSLNEWKVILSNVKEVIKKFSLHPSNISNVEKQKALFEMYIQKTIERLDAFQSQSLIDFSKPIVINQIEYDSLENQIKKLKNIVITEKLIENADFLLIHGDLCFSNILIDSKSKNLKLIDPRGQFGNIELYGDVLYEWAKLAHSIDGKYDFIISDKFNIVKNSNNISYHIHSSNLHEEIAEYFYTEITPPEQLNKIKLIQSLLFFSMLPLHNDHRNRQYIMLCKAIELIHPFLK